MLDVFRWSKDMIQGVSVISPLIIDHVEKSGRTEHHRIPKAAIHPVDTPNCRSSSCKGGGILLAIGEWNMGVRTC